MHAASEAAALTARERALRNITLQKGLGLCITGGLRGICESHQGISQLYSRVLRGFEALGGFDVFAVVPTKDCDRAQRLLGAPPVLARITCVDELGVPPLEWEWVQNGPLADPNVCPGLKCGYVWRDVATCAQAMRRRMLRDRISYWRVARARNDLHWRLFPKDPASAFAAEDTIWSYAMPDGQWIAVPDRFAIGPQGLMFDAYFSTYDWMLDEANWPLYDPEASRSCVRRGHIEFIPKGNTAQLIGESVREGWTRGKLWACPEPSAAGMAYPGPENVLEAHLRWHGGVKVRLRRDMCFDHVAGQCGVLKDSTCQRRPKRSPHGVWEPDPEVAVRSFMDKAVLPGNARFESGVLHHDGIFAARLAEFFIEEWGRAGRPQKVLDFGCARGALVEQLDRWNLPAVGIDGGELVELLLGQRGLRFDFAATPSPRHLSEAGDEFCGGVGGTSPQPAEAAEKAWCTWRRGLRGADWVLALDVVDQLPRAYVRRFAAHVLAHSRRGVLLSWPGGLRNRKARELLRHLQDAGMRIDRAASDSLQHFGGLLCCPTHRKAVVLRRRQAYPEVGRWGGDEAGFRICKPDVVEELPGSGPCSFKQSYGCDDTGVWVHFDCAARFWRLHDSGFTSVAECRSLRNEYAECSWTTIEDAAARRPARQAHRREARHAVRNIHRTDMINVPAPTRLLRLPNSSRDTFFATLFGLTTDFMFDAMDPITVREGDVWPGSRVLTMAFLRAFKLTVLDGLHLHAEIAQWSSEWPRLRRFLVRWSPKWPPQAPQEERQHFALLVASLSAAASHAARGSHCSEIHEMSSWWPPPAELRLGNPCDAALLELLDEACLELEPTETRPIWFAYGDEGPSGPHFRPDDYVAQYLFRLAYRAPAASWRL